MVAMSLAMSLGVVTPPTEKLKRVHHSYSAWGEAAIEFITIYFAVQGHDITHNARVKLAWQYLDWRAKNKVAELEL